MKSKYYIKCPQCGNRERFKTPHKKYIIPAWLTVGMSSLYRNYQRKQTIECIPCGHVFLRPAVPQALIGKAFYYLALLLISFAAFSYVVGKYIDTSKMEDYEIIQNATSLINDNIFVLSGIAFIFLFIGALLNFVYQRAIVKRESINSQR